MALVATRSESGVTFDTIFFEDFPENKTMQILMMIAIFFAVWPSQAKVSIREFLVVDEVFPEVRCAQSC